MIITDSVNTQTTRVLMFYDFVSSQLFRENVSHGRKADIEQEGTD